MASIDFEGQRFEVQHLAEPHVAIVFLDGAVQGCADIVRGMLVASLCADGSSRVPQRTVAQVALRSGYGVGCPVA
jgi:hypothetical protein